MLKAVQLQLALYDTVVANIDGMPVKGLQWLVN